MATIDEVFASMSASDATSFEYLVIDPATRTISVPESEMIFGVQQDEKAERKYFLSPRFVASGLDLAGCFIRVNYRNAKGDIDGYLVNDVSYTDDAITFSWELSEKVTAYQGDIQFSINADNGKREWNTTTATGKSLVGLSIDESEIESETSDVVTQLRAMVETQTAAVESEGATQVTNVQKTAVDATEEARIQIDAKAEATLATIPEDYTSIANKTNEFANALKGSVSGTAVRVDDVSPVEHNPSIKIESKNLIPFPYYHADVTNVRGVDVSVAEDGTITFNGTATADSAYRLTQKATMPVHGTFTLSGCIGGSNSAGGSTYYMQPFIDGVGAPAVSNGSRAYTWDGILTSIAIFFKAGVAFDNVQFKPQLERGSVATDYTPYVAPESVTLTRCGKNILQWPYNDGESYTTGGITYTVQDDGGIHAVGTATANSYYRIMKRSLAGFPRVFTDCTHDSANLFTYVWVKGGETVDKVFYPQVELGTVATEYVKPIAHQTCTPLEDGTVPSVTSAAPTMSLLTDNPNAIIDCEYNKDTTKVIQKLVDAITALGGTV